MAELMAGWGGLPVVVSEAVPEGFLVIARAEWVPGTRSGRFRVALDEDWMQRVWEATRPINEAEAVWE